MTDLLDKLLAQGQPLERSRAEDVEQRSRYTVRNDRWDRQILDKILIEQRELHAARTKLAENVAGELGYDEGSDMFWLLLKHRPELLEEDAIRPSRLLNRAVNVEAVQLPSYEELIQWTSGDPIGSAIAFETIEPDLEELYERHEEEQELAEQYEQALQELMQALADQRTAEQIFAAWGGEGDEDEDEDQEGEGEGEGPGEGDAQDDGQGQTGDGGAGGMSPEQMQQALQDAQAAVAKAQSAVGQAEQQLRESLNSASGDIKSTLDGAMTQANEIMQDLMNLSTAWGQDPGEMMRLPAAKRLELARKLTQGPTAKKFRAMAKFIGPAIRDALACQKRKVIYTPEEITNITFGDDLPRVLPTEFGWFDMEETEWLFLKNFVEKNLTQYDTRGFEKINQGGIIYCHDGSGSMAGDREIWAKAIGGGLLHIARKQKRSFYGIQFGSAHEIRVDDFTDTRNLDPQKVLDFMEFFFNGGTDFEAPLREAMKILEREHAQHGMVKHDIVFATDGACYISPSFMKALKELQQKLDVTIWGINIAAGGAAGRRDETKEEPLFTLCDGKVTTVQQMLNAKDARGIFGGV